VSERIDRLEQHLGCRLLMRSTRAFKCTPEGEIFYEWSKKALDAVERAVAEVSQNKQMLKGMVRIAAPHCLGDVVLPRVITRLHEFHPDLRIDLVLNDNAIDLVTEGVDIAFRLGRLGEGGFVACPLGRLEQILVASPGLLARMGEVRDVADLARLPFLRVKGSYDNGTIALSDDKGATSVAPIRSLMTTSHWRPMYEMILAGGGAGVMLQVACADDLRSGRLVRVLPSLALPQVELNMLTLAQRPALPRVRMLADLLKTLVPEVANGRENGH
jgi:DNA-binding transcriptional LysR family regulator